MDSQLDYVDFGDSIVSSNDYDVSYCVDEQIASGGYGTLYRVYKEDNGCVFAMKVFDGPQRLESSWTIEDSRREVMMLTRLDHQHIIEYEDEADITDFNNEQILCLFMKLADGDLDDIFRNCTLDDTHREMLAQSVGYQMCSALEFLQSSNIVHADIKPGNILYFRFGPNYDLIHFRLSDFGLAQDLNNEGPIELGGTPGYMAPEVDYNRTNRRYATKVDIYSLGMVLYNMITDNLGCPFDGYGTIPARTRIIDWMIRYKPRARPSAWNCLQDNWMRGGSRIRSFEPLNTQGFTSDEADSCSSSDSYSSSSDGDDDNDEDDSYCVSEDETLSHEMGHMGFC